MRLMLWNSLVDPMQRVRLFETTALTYLSPSLWKQNGQKAGDKHYLYDLREDICIVNI